MQFHDLDRGRIHIDKPGFEPEESAEDMDRFEDLDMQAANWNSTNENGTSVGSSEFNEYDDSSWSSSEEMRVIYVVYKGVRYATAFGLKK